VSDLPTAPPAAWPESKRFPERPGERRKNQPEKKAKPDASASEERHQLDEMG
jgi:hypothetical protein